MQETNFLYLKGDDGKEMLSSASCELTIQQLFRELNVNLLQASKIKFPLSLILYLPTYTLIIIGGISLYFIAQMRNSSRGCN